MNYKTIDKSAYYRKDTYRRFTEECKCSASITARLDVTELAAYSKKTNTKFYINFLYILAKVLNSRDDYKMGYLYQSDELVCYDVIHPTHYVFRKETETCTPVYSEYCEDYKAFYRNAFADIEKAKVPRAQSVHQQNQPNRFEASYLPWVSYDSLHMELPDGYLYFPPVVHWGKYREESGRLMMPVTVRMNHAIADGYLIAKVFELLQKEMKQFMNNQ